MNCSPNLAIAIGILIVSLNVGGCTTPGPSAALPAVPIPAEPQQALITGLALESEGETVRLVVQATEAVQYTAFKVENPPQVVVDIAGATLGDIPRPLPVAEGLIQRLEPLVVPETAVVRLIVHLERMLPYTVEARGQQVVVAFNKATAPQAEVLPQGETAKQGQEAAAAAPAAPPTRETLVTDIAYSALPGASVIEMQTVGAVPKVQVRQRRDPLRLSLEVAHARLSPEQERRLAVSDPAGIVTQLQASQHDEPGTATVSITAYLQAEVLFEVQQEKGMVWLVLTTPPARAAPTPAPGQEAVAPAGITPAPSGTPGPVAATTIAPPPPRYSGQRISLDFQNADITDILRLIAEVSGLNIIAGPDVKGAVTTRMVDVPWDQALEVILKVNGLAQEREGNIIRVAPLDRFINERQERLRARQTEVQIEPTVTRLMPVSYADVKELKANLEPLLSDRGSILINARTNTLIITDTEKNLDSILTLLKTLDRQTPQVMIEARIVETSRNFLRELGIQIGGQFTQLTNFHFPNRLEIRGGVPGATGGGGLVRPSAGNFLVDLPAAVTTGAGGAIGFSLATPGVSKLLDLQLSALEASGRGKIISNPKIATLDNTEAIIQSGVRIPFETRSEQGTQTQFVDASISLKVTPHVTPDSFIGMKIIATKNEPDFARTSVGGVPTIATREASTEMLVKDGDTVVIGGLYRRTIQSNRDGVPGLSKVPVLGWLFKTEQELDNSDELLVFITPRIIRQAEEEGRRGATAY